MAFWIRDVEDLPFFTAPLWSIEISTISCQHGSTYLCTDACWLLAHHHRFFNEFSWAPTSFYRSRHGSAMVFSCPSGWGLPIVLTHKNGVTLGIQLTMLVESTWMLCCNHQNWGVPTINAGWNGSMDWFNGTDVQTIEDFGSLKQEDIISDNH